MYKTKSCLRALVTTGCLSVVSATHAAIVFTMNGTATNDFLGYAIGDGATFIFTTSESFPNNASSSFTPDQNYWVDDSTAYTPLWASVSVTGLTGGYARPATVADDPQSSLAGTKFGVSGTSVVFSFDASARASDIGLSASTGEIITGISGNVVVRNLSAYNLANTGAYTEPVQNLSGFTGVYTDLSPSIRIINITDGASTVTFNISNLTISETGAAVIPEPSTYALYAGIMILGVMLSRRRRKSLQLKCSANEPFGNPNVYIYSV